MEYGSLRRALIGRKNILLTHTGSDYQGQLLQLLQFSELYAGVPLTHHAHANN